MKIKITAAGARIIDGKIYESGVAYEIDAKTASGWYPKALVNSGEAEFLAEGGKGNIPKEVSQTRTKAAAIAAMKVLENQKAGPKSKEA